MSSNERREEISCRLAGMTFGQSGLTWAKSTSFSFEKKGGKEILFGKKLNVSSIDRSIELEKREVDCRWPTIWVWSETKCNQMDWPGLNVKFHASFWS